jgi:hypothetical protein
MKAASGVAVSEHPLRVVRLAFPSSRKNAANTTEAWRGYYPVAASIHRATLVIVPKMAYRVKSFLLDN